MTPAERLAKNKKSKQTDNPRHGKFKCLIADLRSDLRLSLRDVAGEVGLSDATIYDVENGSDPQLSNAFALAKFFGKRIDEIWVPIA